MQVGSREGCEHEVEGMIWIREGCAGVEGARGRGVQGWRVLGEGGVCRGGGC